MYIWWGRWNIESKILIIREKEELLLQRPSVGNSDGTVSQMERLPCGGRADSTFIAKLRRANMPRCSKGIEGMEWAYIWSLIASCSSGKWKLSSSAESEDDERGVEDFRREGKLENS